MRIGFLGLGAIGHPMAARLSRVHDVAVWNRTAERAQAFAAEHGALAAATPREAAAGREAVITCLPTSAEVLALLEGPDGLEAGLGPGTLFLDCTSGDSATTRRIAARLAARGVAFADAPVSGGTNGAESGTLTVMVGGDRAVFERAVPVLQAFGKRIVHTGARVGQRVARPGAGPDRGLARHLPAGAAPQGRRHLHGSPRGARPPLAAPGARRRGARREPRRARRDGRLPGADPAAGAPGGGRDPRLISRPLPRSPPPASFRVSHDGIRACGANLGQHAANPGRGPDDRTAGPLRLPPSPAPCIGPLRARNARGHAQSPRGILSPDRRRRANRVCSQGAGPRRDSRGRAAVRRPGPDPRRAHYRPPDRALRRQRAGGNRGAGAASHPVPGPRFPE